MIYSILEIATQHVAIIGKICKRAESPIIQLILNKKGGRYLSSLMCDSRVMTKRTNMNFTAIDFETAVGKHACAVGMVTVQNGEIVDEFYALIRPPQNTYHWHTIQVHGIRPEDTANEKSFSEVFPEIYQRLEGRVIVAHNAAFDRSVLKACMNAEGIDTGVLEKAEKWECTLKIYRAKGFKPCSLRDCCRALNINLSHHQALSDARACAELYLRR